MSKIRAWTRYWLNVPLLLSVVGLQMCISFTAIQTSSDNKSADAGIGGQGEAEQGNNSIKEQISTSLPSPTPIPSITPSPSQRFVSSPATPAHTLVPTFTPTFTPSPTSSPTFIVPPTDTATPVVLPTNTSTSMPTDTTIPLNIPTPLPVATPARVSIPSSEPTPTASSDTLRVPILMYHYISVPPKGADAIRQDLSVSPAQFEAHLAYLRQAGYETISMKDLSFALSQQAPLPAKPIIISFDDGYRDTYENAFSLLRKYSYKGIFFIFTQPIDTHNVDYLTWEMVIEMHKAGMEFGSHSYRHPDLTARDIDFLVFEILGSKEAIEERIGELVRFFSYPAGRYDSQTIEVLKSANFWGAVTTEWGVEHSFERRFEMPRIRMRGNDTAEHLAEKLDSF